MTKLSESQMVQIDKKFTEFWNSIYDTVLTDEQKKNMGSVGYQMEQYLKEKSLMVWFGSLKRNLRKF